jgi:anti-anti-sigma regulatory factor
MQITSPAQAYIAYELVDDIEPNVVVIEFLAKDLAGPTQAHELEEELESLIRPDLPPSFVIDFTNVRSLGSTPFSVVVSFARKVGHLQVCNLPKALELGAMLTGLDEWVEVAPNRRSAIAGARREALKANFEGDTG